MDQLTPVGISIEPIEAQPTEEQGDDDPEDGLQCRIDLHSIGTLLCSYSPSTGSVLRECFLSYYKKLYYFSLSKCNKFLVISHAAS